MTNSFISPHKSKYIRQAGFTIVEVAVVVAIIAIAAIAGYLYLANRSDSNLPNPLNNIALNPNCSYNDPDLCKFLNNWKMQDNYTVVATADGGTEAGTTSQYEIDGAEKFSALIKQADGTEVYHIISIGDTVYTYDSSDGQWWKQTQTNDEDDDVTADFRVDFDADSNENSDQPKTEYIKKDKAACGDRTCFVYEVIMGADASGTELIYFDDKDYILRQMVSTYEDATTTSTYTYGQAEITEPSPVKEAASDMPLYPGGQTLEALPGMTEEELQQWQEMMPDLSSQ